MKERTFEEICAEIAKWWSKIQKSPLFGMDYEFEVKDAELFDEFLEAYKKRQKLPEPIPFRGYDDVRGEL